MDIEKPKKALSEKQLANLQKMREKKAIKKKAMEIIEEKKTENDRETQREPDNNFNEIKNNLNELNTKLNSINEYIEQKKNKKKQVTEFEEFQTYENPLWNNIFNK